ncbi:hypothetical protein BOTBODRAFT_29433 [Botryobasidium botryosum FD-172 SS1]|uniref:RNA helicase n=1 Tax=Botryobasidium botryosum (strain FD-172 SS1) TaxID=930990 RepID=A0A067N2V2_BOTB1|nr:hypothetical protein BOTBODRAFT_29433 [Botryobasidium botryosum FD-172 SS1]
MGNEPLSIELLVQRQKEEREAASKPKFLTKEERAKIAIEKRAQEIKAQREREQKVAADREKLERQADDLRRKDEWDGRDDGRRNSRYDDRHNRRDRRNDDRPPPPNRPAYQNGVPTGPRADRARNAPSGSGPVPPARPSPSSAANASLPNESAQTPFTPPLTETDLSAIRSRYLGVDKKKRKIRKMNDRKFVFDWDEQEDTFASASVTPGLKTAGVMFGRGHLAGMDGGDANAGAGSGSTGKGTDTGPRHADSLERRKAAKSGIDERHWTEKPLSEMKERDWRIFREDFSISARGGHIPLPLRSWEESAIPQSILDIIASVGYKEPSAIQRQAIPIGLQNRDLIGIAETGSGKTASFVIPMLIYISQLPPLSDDNRHLGPYALILAPTRELAQQIESEAKKFASPLGFKCVSIVGGRAVEEQQFNLREGAEIIIATPGRLKDVIDRHVIVLSQCRYVVMDEADRMVHLGFEVDLTYILESLPSESITGDGSVAMDVDGAPLALPPVPAFGSTSMSADEEAVPKERTRVTTLFSATMPPAVERLARKYLKKPAVITIGEAGRAVDTVEQRVEFVQGDEKKKARVLEILNNEGYPAPIIVFVNQKKTADMVAKDLSRAGWSTSTLHSGKNQEQREAALAALRTGDAHILVATDLAGRGIDVQDVSLVINFQMANTIEAYVHRIGRTGRAGKQGTAITFLTNDDDEVMYDLKQEISKSPVSKVPPELARHEAAQQKISREMKRKRDGEDQG